MRRLALAAALLLTTPLTAAAGDKPDFRPMIHMIGANGISHGCPIAPNLVLTAGHVVDLAPLDPRVRLFPSRFSTELQGGWLDALFASHYSDIAAMTPVYEPLAAYYPVAKKAPKIGDKLYWVGYNWDKRKHAMEEQIFEGRYLMTLAGHVITDRQPEPGSSGGCILTEQGEAVGIVSWGVGYGESDGISIGPAIYPPWDRMLLEQITTILDLQKEK